MPAVYDDERVENKPGQHDDLGVDPVQRHAEAEALKRQFDGSPDSVRSGEEAADLSDTAGKAERAELGKLGDDTVGKGYNDSDKGGLLSRAKKKVSGMSPRAKLGIGTGFGAGGIVAMLFFSLGSLAPVHLSKILSLDNHGNETTSNVQMNGLLRYARSGGNLGETRVTAVGSRVFKSTNAKLANIGVTFNANEQFGQLKGTIIDTEKFPATKGMNRDQSRAALAEYFSKNGITEADIKNISGSKLYVNSENLGISATRGLVNSIVSSLDGGELSTWQRARIIKTYFNLPSLLHPIKRVDAKIQTSAEKTVTARAREKARKATRVVKSSEVDAAKVSLKEKTTGARAAAGSALLVTAGICLARGAADDAITYNRGALVIPQVVEATDKIAVGAQQPSGMDFTAIQMAAVNESLSDDAGNSVWQGRALKAKTDPNTTEGEDLPWEYGQAFSSSGGASNLKDLGGFSASIACSTPGQIVQGGLGLLLLAASFPTGGGTGVAYAALKTGGSIVLGAGVMVGLHQLITSALKDDPFPESLSAPVRGNLMAYGSRELANITARSGGGVELSPEESAAIDNDAAQASQNEFQSKSLYAKVFDASDYRSVAGKFVDQHTTSPGLEIQNVAQGFLNFPATLSAMTRVFTPKTSAAGAPYDYGFNRYGIPARILDDPKYDDPYENADAAGVLLSGEGGQAYIDRAKACFGVSIEKDAGLWTVLPKEDVNPNSSKYEDAHCNSAGDTNWDRMILFVNASVEMDSAACFVDDDDQACQNIGFDELTAPDSSTTQGGGDLTIASFNILHSADQPEKVWKDRLHLSVGVLTDPDNPVDVAGLQEVRQDQMDAFNTDEFGGLTYDMWPKTVKKADYSPNPIIWNKSKYRLVSSEEITIKYFGGNNEEVPLVKLEDVSDGPSKGQQFYVLNTHDPADAHGEADKYRFDNANHYANDVIPRLMKENIPIFFTGDFNSGYSLRTGDNNTWQNDRNNLTYCIVTHGTGMYDSYDSFKGYTDDQHKNGWCPTENVNWNDGFDADKAGNIVDHIFVSSDVKVTGLSRAVSGEKKNGSDHDTVIANIKLPGGDDTTDDSPAPLPAQCYTVTKQRGSSTEGKMFHESGSQTYAFENSPAGIKFAANNGFDSIDLDVHMTKDNVPVVTHWDKPIAQDNFFDPQGKIGKDTMVKDMTYDEITRLRNKDGQSQIYSLVDMIKVLSENKVNLSMELKDGSIKSKYPEIAGALNQYKVKAYMKGHATENALDAALTSARNFGFWTRGTKNTQDWRAPGPGCQ